MKINVSDGKPRFALLNTGEVFMYQNNYFIKTEILSAVNAVNLYDGLFAQFNDNDVVTLIDAELQGFTR